MANGSILRVKLKNDTGETVEHEWAFSGGTFVINDSLLAPILEANGWEKISFCQFILGASNTSIIVEDFTYTETIHIEGFSDIRSYVSIFQSKGVSVHIVDQTVDLMQLDCPNILLANCHIRQLDIGLAEHFCLLRNASENNQHDQCTAYSMKSIDLRSCTIDTIASYVECDSIILQQHCKISSFSLIGGFGGSIAAEIKQLFITNYSVVENLEVHCVINSLTFNDSTVSNIVAKAKCLIKSMSVDDTTILNAHRFEEKHFQTISYDGWLLISQSAANNKNNTLRAHADYELAKINYESETGVNKLIGRFFKLCTGYGYKPMRAIASCGLLIGIVTVILTVIGLTTNSVSFTNALLNSFLIGLSGIVGQSGVSNSLEAVFWIVTIEYLLGIVLFAMFVNALYVRYKR